MQCHCGSTTDIGGKVDTNNQSKAVGCLEDRVVYCIIWEVIVMELLRDDGAVIQLIDNSYQKLPP